MLTHHLLPLLALLTTALAKTDLSGCTTSNTISYGGAYVLWYVPGTGELCEPLDCGGGMAPPKTTVPGCAAYVGTASYVPSYLPGYGPNSVPATASAASMIQSAGATTGVWSSASASASKTGLATYTVTPSSGAVVSGSSSFATITSAASLSIKPTVSSGGSNLTATVTKPSSTSQFTGAATTVGVKEVFGVAVGVVAGLVML